MSRPIRDAKDITTGQKVYLKGHAQATFMSDGRTVETAINEAMQGGGSGVVSADEVYVFEWDGESDSGTLSEAELAKLLGAKYAVLHTGVGYIAGHLFIPDDDAFVIEFTQITPIESSGIGSQSFIFYIDSKSGAWSLSLGGGVCLSANEENIKNWGFATTDEVNTAIQDAVTNALNTAV